MKLVVLLIALCVASTIPEALTASYLIYKTWPTIFYHEAPSYWEEKYEPVQVRLRRDVSVGTELPTDGGARVSAQGSGTVWQDENSRVDADAHWARTYGGAGGPPTYGGGLSYHHPRGGAAVDVSRTPGFGTLVGAQGEANLWRSDDGRGSLDANANWSRNYGGPWGTSRPNYGVGLDLTYHY